MAKTKWNLPNFNAIVNDYQAIADELDDAAYECIETAQSIQYDAMIEGLSRHRKTGGAMRALRKKPIRREANRTYTDLGIDLQGGNDGEFWGALAQEYGTPHFKKDPWMRPAIDNSKAKIEAAWRSIFARRGYPMK